MKHKIFVIFISIIALTSPAWACHITSFSADANCDGWTVTGAAYVCGTRDTLAYDVTLSQNGRVITTFTDFFVVWADDPTFSLNVPWGIDLSGDYVATGRVSYISPPDITDFREFEIAFTCGDNFSCHFTPGFWKNHPDAWPVRTLTLGDRSYNQRRLIRILRQPVRGDATIILAHHLIAAKLNVANGADESISDAIDAADRQLRRHPLGSRPRRSAKTRIIYVKNLLKDYNELITPGCGDNDLSTTFNKVTGPSSEPDEERSWGEIKAIYR